MGILSKISAFVPGLDQILTGSGLMGLAVTRVPFNLAKNLPEQVIRLMRTYKLMDEESVNKLEDLIENIIHIVESEDLEALEDPLGELLEIGLFGLSALHPIVLFWGMMLMKAAVISGATALVDRDMLSEEEAIIRARTVCARMWEVYGKVYHGQEYHGLENIPEKDGALIIYYHGPVQVDYFGLVGEIWLSRGRFMSSVVDRTLDKTIKETLKLDKLSKYLNLFPGTVDSCAELLQSGELLGIAPGGAYESLFGDTSYPVLWQSRLGFARVALKANKPIIPVFTENIRESVFSVPGRMTAGRKMWEHIYESTKMPLVPMYGLFPVKLKTHVGSPIYPKPGMTPEQMRQLTVDAMEKLIAQHQNLPGNLGQALAGRVFDQRQLEKNPVDPVVMPA